MTEGTAGEIHRLAGRSPGEDVEDPYTDVDVDTLPDWWIDAIEEFDAHGLRHYRPPRFQDGTLKYQVVSRLEDDLGISIRMLGHDVTVEDDWQVEVDGSHIGEISRYRSPDGYTVFEMDANEFEAWVRQEVVEA